MQREPALNLLRLAQSAAVLLVAGTAPLAAQINHTAERSLFSMPRSQDDIHQRKVAMESLRNGEYASAVNQLHRLLKRIRGGIVEVGPDRYWGMRHAVLQILRDLPPEAQEAYETLVRREAGSVLRTAFAGRNIPALEVLARNFPTSASGRRALRRLGDLHLEAGEAQAAAAYYRCLRDALPTKLDEDTQKALDQRRAAVIALQQPWSPEADEEIKSLAQRSERGLGWPAYGGGWDGTRPMSNLPGASEDLITLPLSCPGYQGDLHLVAHAVGGLSGVYLSTGTKVKAYDPIAGKLLWEAEGHMSRHDVDEYYDTLNPRMLLAAAVSDKVVVAALQVPNDSERQSYQTLRLTYKLPSRRLFAFDRRTGKRLWSHWDYSGGPRSRRFAAHNAPAPVTIVDDTIYAPTEHYTGAISHYLSAYDLETGEPKWRTLVCSSQLEVNMFGNATKEYAASPVAVHQGVIYGVTNLGICYAVDASHGDLLWATAYPVIPLPRTRLRRQRSREIYFENNPCVVRNGVLVCTPLDSQYILGLDTDTGRILWRLTWHRQGEHENQIRWLLGCIGNEAILSGRGVIAVTLDKGMGASPAVRQVRAPDYYNIRSAGLPRGALSGDKVLFPAPDGLHELGLDGSEKRLPVPMRAPGNLVAIDGLLMSARTGQVDIFRDRQALLADAERQRREEPDNPAHDLRLAILLRASHTDSEMGGKIGERILEVLRSGLRKAGRQGMGQGSPLGSQLQRELFKLSMVRAGLFREGGDEARAMRILVAARDAGGPPREWIQAQLEILDLLAEDPDRQLREWDRLADRHGKLSYRIPGLGTVPLGPYALWRSTMLPRDPAEQIRRAQELLVDHPQVNFGTYSSRDFAIKHIAGLIAKHGREPYAAIERRAAGYLQMAGDDVARLRAIDQHYPHSLAARKARNLVLDVAVKGGDLRTASAMVRGAAGTGLDPSAMRRLMVAAERAGNRPLAEAIGARLLREAGDHQSDYGPDGGKSMAQLITPRPLPQPPQPEPRLPSHELPGLVAGDSGYRPESLAMVMVPGYASAGVPPLFVVEAPSRIGAYQIGTRKGREEARFRIDMDTSTQQVNPVYHCGDRVILSGGDRILAASLKDGAELWTHGAERNRQLEVLEVTQGVVQCFSTQGRDDDAGRLVGIDVQAGAQLYEVQLDPLAAETLKPRTGLGDLWTLYRNRQTKGVELLRFDGLTGRELLRAPLPASAMGQLGLPPGADTRLDRLQDGMMINASGVYLAARSRRNRSGPAVLALDLAGKPRWFWQSKHRESSLKEAALHERGVVVMESIHSPEQRYRLMVLEPERGTETRVLEFSGKLRWINEPHHGPRRAPDILLLEAERRSVSVLVWSLKDGYPSFSFDTRKNAYLWGRPLIGDDFVAVTQLDSNGHRMQLLVIDPKTRQGALPNAQFRRPLPARMRNSASSATIHPHGPFMICHTREGIRVYGNQEDSTR